MSSVRFKKTLEYLNNQKKMVELQESEREKVSYMLTELIKGRNLNADYEGDFVTDEFFEDIIKATESFIGHLMEVQ